MKIIGARIWICLAILLAVSPAHAGLLYSYSTDRPAYNVNTGGTIGVQVFLNETGSPGDPFVLAPGGDGLFSTGVRLNYPSSAVAKVLSGGNIQGNPSFDNFSGTIATDVNPAIATAGFTQFSFFSNVYGVPIAGGYRVLLGTFTFTAGATPGSFAFAVTRFNAGNNTLTGANIPLDSLTSGTSATIQVGEVAPIPEPPTIVSAAPVALFGLGYWWHRRRAKT